MDTTADTDEEIEVSADGVTVRKRYTADEFPVPTIRFEIESERDDDVVVRLSEDIPESFPMDGVGFHPEYHSDDWTAFQDNRVEFAGTVAPGDALETVYGIRLDDDDEPTDFLGEPEIVEVGAEEETATDDVVGDIVDEDRNEPVKEMITGDAEAVPGLDAEDEAEEEDADEADELDLDLEDVDAEPDAEPEVDEPETEDAPDIDLGFDEGTATDDQDEELSIDLDVDEDDERDAAVGASVSARLAAEIRDGRVDDDDLAVLRDELDLEPTSADVARIDHLQSRVETVAAYTDALEEFLDEEGTGEQLIEEFREELSTFESEIDAFDDRLESTEERVDDVEGDVDDVEDGLETVEDEVADVEDGLEAVEDDLETVEEDLEDVRSEVTDIQEWRDELGSMFADT